MKNLTLLLLVLIASCTNTQNTKPEIINKQLSDTRYDILILDSCEYIVFAWVPRDDHVITHKGNCKFCIERNSKK